MRKKFDSNCPKMAVCPATSATTYSALLTDISGLLEQARRTTVYAINNILTTTYWEIGRRIVEFEQGAEKRQNTERS